MSKYQVHCKICNKAWVVESETLEKDVGCTCGVSGVLSGPTFTVICLDRPPEAEPSSERKRLTPMQVRKMNRTNGNLVSPTQEEREAVLGTFMVGAFGCLDCGKEFKFNFDGKNKTPFCVDCKSTNLVAKSPQARIISQGDFTVKETKLYRFIKKAYRNKILVERHFDGLIPVIQRLGLSSDIEKGFLFEFESFKNRVLDIYGEETVRRVEEYEKAQE